jgi:signal transduction histidine kinase
VEGLRAQFEPVANNRGLTLQLRLAPEAPEVIETDPQRLEQVLRNLLSNALKFTERGEVTLDINPAGQDRVAFAVRDTGIGIEPHQQRIIFEPFCQADGTTNRKYGGTGLGLSISRELSRLLGGEIHLTSEVGVGSTFTVTLPTRYESAVSVVLPAARQEEPSSPALPSREPAAVRSPRPRPTVPDDRQKLNPAGRVILVVEDDPRFAGVLADLARDHQFQ